MTVCGFVEGTGTKGLDPCERLGMVVQTDSSDGLLPARLVSDHIVAIIYLGARTTPVPRSDDSRVCSQRAITSLIVVDSL